MQLKSLLILAVALFDIGMAFQCYSTLGTNKKWNDNGNEVECRMEAGFIKRKCVKFKTGNNQYQVF